MGKIEKTWELRLRSEIAIIQKVRNILHAHNRSDTPLYNEDRVAARGYSEGVIRRLTQLAEDMELGPNG